jgi:hypothetical protein
VVRNNAANAAPSDAAADEPAVITREEVPAQDVPAGPRLQLRVLDAATGADLRDVLVVEWPLQPPQLSLPPASTLRVLVEGGSSPVAFAPAKPGGESIYCVRTPLHAWSDLAIAADSTEMHEVPLEPGGDLEVAFTGVQPPDGVVLRFRKSGASELECEADLPETGSARIEGLPAVRFACSLEKGADGPEAIVVGRAEVQVQAGATVRTTIHVDHVAEPPRVRAAGRLTISPAWNAHRMWLEPRGTARTWHPESTSVEVAMMERSSDTEYVWDAGTLTVGTYRVGFAGLNYWTMLEVRADDTGLHIVVPDPCQVQVRAVDNATERPITAEDQRLRWFGLAPADVEGVRRTVHGEVSVNGAFDFVAAPGGMRLYFQADGYRGQGEAVEVTPGHNEFTVRARRDFGIDVVLEHAGADVRWERGFRWCLLDGANQPVSGHFDGRGRMRPESSGRLRLVFEELGDYVADPVLVDVPEVGWVRVVVPVRRR